nr:MAG TPA: hypothetical protein [Caudoviricetes sp.]
MLLDVLSNLLWRRNVHNVSHVVHLPLYEIVRCKDAYQIDIK